MVLNEYIILQNHDNTIIKTKQQTIIKYVTSDGGKHDFDWTLHLQLKTIIKHYIIIQDKLLKHCNTIKVYFRVSVKTKCSKNNFNR